ncbi:MAG: amino acid--[acyl-carrier-protein] ligase [Pseudomonadales bacterium]
MIASQAELTRQLVNSGHWISSKVNGVFGWGRGFEVVVSALDHRVTQFSDADAAIPVNFPPVLDRSILVRTGYLQSFPELCGSVHSFCGAEHEHQQLLGAVEAGADWSPHLQQTDVALTPAVCYPLYPTLAGTLPEDGVLYSLSSYVFRHEPSLDPARLQAFRMRENVRLGDPAQVVAWRQLWMDRALSLLKSLELEVALDIATDPFFGRGGKMMKANQKEDQGKFEILCPISSVDEPTAVASFNYHQTKFSSVYEILLANGTLAHSACIGFGLERCALALFATHGMELDSWPLAVRRDLGI